MLILNITIVYQFYRKLNIFFKFHFVITKNIACSCPSTLRLPTLSVFLLYVPLHCMYECLEARNSFASMFALQNLHLAESSLYMFIKSPNA
jgi:hypothetical protein